MTDHFVGVNKMVELEPARKALARGLCVATVSRAAPFVESAAGEYTHRTRQVTLHSILGRTHMGVRAWCGMTLLVAPPKKKGRLVFAPGPGRPICATCEGRAIGAGLLGSREIAGRPVLYRGRT
jgi:hypothetical protein